MRFYFWPSVTFLTKYALKAMHFMHELPVTECSESFSLRHDDVVHTGFILERHE